MIEAADYEINETFASSHLYYQDPTRWRDYIIYVANSGLFAYNMRSHEVTPILLEPRTPDLRIVYRYPRVTESGILLVTGLTSTSGAVGADGPVYQVDLGNVLP